MNELFKGSINELVTEASNRNISIADLLLENSKKEWSGMPSDGEINSWDKSLNHLLEVIQSTTVLKNTQILVEYRLPSKLDRIDCIILGSKEDTPIALLVELKQWSNVQKTKSTKRVKYEWNNETVRSVHPCFQVGNYDSFLKSNHSFLSSENVKVISCVYMHNLPDTQLNNLMPELYPNIPIFNKEEELKRFITQTFDSKLISKAITEKISQGEFHYNDDLLNVLGNFLDDKKQPFHLIGNQQTAYEKIFEIIENEGRDIIVVKGSPGTGKTAVALNLLFLAKNKEYKDHMRFLFPSNTLSMTILATLGKDFRHYYSAIVNEGNKNKIVIVDEAHRLPKVQKKDSSDTLLGLITASRVLVLFLDERQQILPNEVGTYDYVKKSVEIINEKYNKKIRLHKPIELDIQYRCHEQRSNEISLGYLQVLDRLLYENPEEKLSTSYKIYLKDNPTDLVNSVKKHSKSRVVAGFCWEWSERKKGLIDDIVIGDFSAPWNRRPVYRSSFDKETAINYSHVEWVMNTEGTEREIGCIYTAQGFDFDYIGVIWGEDLFWNGTSWSYNLDRNLDQEFISQVFNINKDLLIYNKEDRVWLILEDREYVPLTRHKSPIIKDEDIIKLLKNRYRVLLTRGKNGCYVFFVEDRTELYFKQRLNFCID